MHMNPAVATLSNGTDSTGTSGTKSFAKDVLNKTATLPDRLQHIWIVTGPAGCGKTTVARGLQTELGLPFLEGDDVSCQKPILQSPRLTRVGTVHLHSTPALSGYL